mgnify:CR=1 FL=1
MGCGAETIETIQTDFSNREILIGLKPNDRLYELNAFIQCLSHIEQLTNYIKYKSSHIKEQKLYIRYNKSGKCLVDQFIYLINKLWPEEAKKGKYEEAYKKAYRAYHASNDYDFDFSEYLLFWLEEIYRERSENTSYMLAGYVIHDLLLPNMEVGRIKLKYISTDYLDALLLKVSKSSETAGNKARELLSIAFKDGMDHGYITQNPVPSTKPYKRNKPRITVLSKPKVKVLLNAARDNSFFCEILLALFCGLRKGEIYGLKWSDIDFENKILHVRNVCNFSAAKLLHHFLSRNPY